jgi:hypothetical protein
MNLIVYIHTCEARNSYGAQYNCNTQLGTRSGSFTTNERVGPGTAAKIKTVVTYTSSQLHHGKTIHGSTPSKPRESRELPSSGPLPSE